MRSVTRLILAATILLLVPATAFRGQDRIRPVFGTANDHFRVVNTYPEYWVDEKPFFEHASAFFYHRIPRDRWAEELLRLKAMGVNTIDLYPFWNWHEPEEGALDFDGHTNPRRDLKYLLRLIDILGFKLTYRPGPFFCSEWRNGGYPDWLLRRPEYHMSEQAILEGRYPRLSALQYDKSEEAAAGWLKNDTHLKYTREWYAHILGLAKPLLADKGGPLISIQLDDDQAIGFENYNGPNFWKYMETLRKDAKAAADESKIPYYINGRDMRENAEANDATADPFWNTGQDYMDNSLPGFSSIEEAAKNRFLLEILKTEPLFVPTQIEFQAGWLLDEKDTFAMPTDPTNTLMATRVMFQSGLKALNYYPLNDTLYPAGYEAQWGNYFYSWEAAVNYQGKETGRAPFVRRNGRLLAGMGPLLASTHFLPDAGLVYPIGTYPQAALTAREADYVVRYASRVLWSGVFDHLNFEFVDSDHGPLENFERYKVLLLPNLINSKEDLKASPHLERYSDRAQRTIEDYVAAGGTLLVFPSLPKGKTFDNLLAPLGEDRGISGVAEIKFADGTTTRALGFHSVLTLPKKSQTDVKVFARDAHNGIVGARFPHGAGQVIFFGADFSRWSSPPGATLSGELGSKPSGRDFPEETQKAARLALPALMKEAGVTRKVHPEMETRKARDLGLYVTELIADSGSLPGEKRAQDKPAYGFVGVTNFSPDEARTAEICLTDPHARNLASPAAELTRLPKITVPPRESLMLPIRLPLSNPFWQTASGLEPSDEIYYATDELTGVHYDGATLRLEFTAPTDGEVAVKLAQKPSGAKINGQEMEIQASTIPRLYIIPIPKAQPPHFISSLELAYARPGPRVTMDPRAPWIAGATRAVRVRVENPDPVPLAGELDFVAGALYKEQNPPLSINIPPRSSREFSFPVEIPREAVENQPVELVTTLRAKGSVTTSAWRSSVTVHQPFTWNVAPTQNFPLREDQPVPIVHPTLANLNLPGEAVLKLSVKNWRDHEEVVTLNVEGSGLNLTPKSSQLVLAANGETITEIHASPTEGSGVYRFTIGLRAGSYQVNEGVVLVALREGEAVAYPLDYDRDGFEDVILENQQVRMFVSPHAGGRSFAFVSKHSGGNAFNSVGGLRDTFTTRFEPEDMKGLPDWTNANWLGLYNRPYSFKILSPLGREAKVQFAYTAPDIYPKGVELERTLTLAGDQSVVFEETTLTPLGIDKPQAYVLETSVPFKVFDEPNYSRWFAQGRPAEDFPPSKKVDLPSASGFVGTVNKQTNETFALMNLTRAAQTQLVVQNHSALIRFLYPPFAEKNQSYRFRAAYYLGKASPQEIESMYGKLK